MKNEDAGTPPAALGIQFPPQMEDPSMSSQKPDMIIVNVQAAPKPRTKDDKTEAETGTDEKNKDPELHSMELEADWVASDAFWVDKTQPFLITVPHCSNVPRGVKLAKLRITAGAKPEAPAWRERDWVQAASGSEPGLGTAFFIFDAMRLYDYTREICLTMNRFDICCPEPFYSLGKKFDFFEVKPALQLPAIRIHAEALSNLVEDAAQSDASMWALADRAITGADSIDLQLALTPAFERLYSLERVEETGQFGLVLESPGKQWLLGCLLDAAKRNPPLAPRLLESINSDVQSVLSSLSEEDQPGCFSKEFVDFMRALFLILFDGIFYQSHLAGRTEKQKQVITTAISEMFAALENLLAAFARGFHMDSNDPRSDTFSVAPWALQAMILQKKNCDLSLAFLVHGRAHCVHYQARHHLLGITRLLSKQDKDFLATADYECSLPDP